VGAEPTPPAPWHADRDALVAQSGALDPIAGSGKEGALSGTTLAIRLPASGSANIEDEHRHCRKGDDKE